MREDEHHHRMADGSVLTVENGVVKSWGDHPVERLPFQPGNKAALKHGGYSDAIIKDRAGQVMEQLAGLYPQVLYMPSQVIERYCLVEARLDLLYEAFMGRVEALGSVVKAMSETPTLSSEISKAEQTSLNYAKELGITVAAWAAIAKNLGYARHFASEKVDGLISTGRALREAQGRAS